LQYYRFSISWSRIFPRGKGAVNPAGVLHYNSLLDSLVAHDIEPVVTLYHWDLPQGLEDEYEGWLGSQVVDDFKAYADTCFALFGDRVKIWITLNEVRSIFRMTRMHICVVWCGVLWC
jgi:beta-glucosidase